MILCGRKVIAVAGTPEPLEPESLHAVRLYLQADPNNSGKIAVGGPERYMLGEEMVEKPAASAPLRGLSLQPSEFLPFAFENTRIGLVYVDAAVSGEAVLWCADVPEMARARV